MFKKTIITTALVLASISLTAQSSRVKDFKPVCKTLDSLIQERTTVHNELKIKNIIRRGRYIDFYFTESLGDVPWKAADQQWFKQTLERLFPKEYRSCRLGDIYAKGLRFEDLATPALTADGQPIKTSHKMKCPNKKAAPLVTRADEQHYPMGLSGRNIALWQSHGRYFDQNARRWQWQRPALFMTNEDLFTQGIVLDFLVPMLENAGAYTMLPRERDTQKEEFIIDNDPYCTEGSPRKHGHFSTTGKWTLGGTGFADTKPVYSGTDNPFTKGTALKIKTLPTDSKNSSATVTWTPDLKTTGEYSVYVSWTSLPESTKNACYTVYHDGGKSRFIVNQKIGGSTWIYLGTFPFAPGKGHKIVLDNRTPEGYRHDARAVVTADAVKIGGGMGNIARRNHRDEDSTAIISGLPRYLEGARYWLQWAGIDSTVYSQHDEKDDYKDDFMSRGPWVEYLTGGSSMNPKMEGKGIPIDLSFALHSDAGVTPNDSTVGTLAIYTYKSDNKTNYPGGGSRMTGRTLSDLVQTQVVQDIRADYDSLWNRRYIWDRYYNESRRPSCPAMLLEFLSHQNFADMRYGHDPSFRFSVGRAVYKGILKYLSACYEVPYLVQPLPVRDFSMYKVPGEDIVVLQWKETSDRLEPTAAAEGFLLETRMDDGSFSHPRVIEASKTQEGIWQFPIRLQKDHLYSFRVSAWNAGGRSFPSEILSAGFPNGSEEIVLVVNNFDRVAAPSWFDTPTYAGFDAQTDRGVPYRRDITYMGDMYEFRRNKEWVTNDNGGFGASYREYTGNVLAGNTFDYPAIHGKAIMKAGKGFISTSASALSQDRSLTNRIGTIDLICGKQITTRTGSGQMDQRFSVFPEQLQKRITEFCQNGGNILVSGANIATDIWDSIYPIEKDSIFTEVSKKFARDVLGFSWGGNHASHVGTVVRQERDTTFMPAKKTFTFYSQPNPDCYSVESPDGILPAKKDARSILRYADTEVSAGIRYRKDNYKTVIFGFPLETLKDHEEIEDLIRATLDWFSASLENTGNECKTGRTALSH